MEFIPTIEKDVSNVQPLEIELHIKLVEKEVKTIEPEVGTKPLVVEDYINCSGGDKCLERCRIHSFHFPPFSKDFKVEIQKYRGGNVKGVR